MVRGQGRFARESPLACGKDRATAWGIRPTRGFNARPTDYRPMCEAEYARGARLLIRRVGSSSGVFDGSSCWWFAPLLFHHHLADYQEAGSAAFAARGVRTEDSNGVFAATPRAANLRPFPSKTQPKTNLSPIGLGTMPGKLDGNRSSLPPRTSTLRRCRLRPSMRFFAFFSVTEVPQPPLRADYLIRT